MGPILIACRDCQKLTAEFASATVEVVAIQRDILARSRARMDISQRSRRWLQEAQAAMDAIKEQLDAHRKTPHRLDDSSVS
jgi:hypothetical protein